MLARFNFNGRVIIPWPVRRIGALGDNSVELLSDEPDPLLNGSGANLKRPAHSRNAQG